MGQALLTYLPTYLPTYIPRSASSLFEKVVREDGFPAEAQADGGGSGSHGEVGR